MMRRRRSEPWFVVVAEYSRENTIRLGGLPPLRSRVLAINNPMIASGKPKKIRAKKAPTTMFSTASLPTWLFFPLHFNRALVEQKRAIKMRQRCLVLSSNTRSLSLASCAA
jgi:hypothetical protein